MDNENTQNNEKPLAQQSPDEAKQTVKDKVSRGVATVAGALEGFTKQMKENDVGQTTKDAVKQVGETTREVASATKEEGQKVKEAVQGQSGSTGSSPQGRSSPSGGAPLGGSVGQSRNPLGGSTGGGSIGGSRPREGPNPSLPGMQRGATPTTLETEERLGEERIGGLEERTDELDKQASERKKIPSSDELSRR